LLLLELQGMHPTLWRGRELRLLSPGFRVEL